mgnify:CR=1 FL=1
MIDEYQEKENQLNDSKSLEEKELHQEAICLLQKDIEELFHKVKYWYLNNNKRPYLFAFSAFMDDGTRKQTIKAGFDGCLQTPLTLEMIQNLVSNSVDTIVTQFLIN